ncbi:MAG: glycerol-3-phosphate dehydrogenase/oxidase [Thermoguttaceae bacterium]|nr:glycerol-3-phosphate dehydrogenase/oxidase [Thermoguttaceae bacterium]MDW8036832.1 glycerol-3-phosphate dehydrogenase/oxidase [Thermoguttaceae bacterium]
MSEARWQQRRRLIQQELSAGEYDLLIIGGGIVGAGVARDAALRGLRVALCEQYDFAFGTSSRTSRLLHGGLRYLAQGRIGLVWQASREKCILHRIAPHLAQPLEFLFPTYRRSGWPRWQLGIGVKLYDLLCSGRNLGPSHLLSAEEVRQILPGIRSEGLTGGVAYYDALTQDARLVLDTLRSAHRAGAVLANYMKVLQARRANTGWLVQVEDQLTGQGVEVSARAIVHATGPWAEQLPQSSLRLRRTKGVHLVLDRHRLEIRASQATAPKPPADSSGSDNSEGGEQAPCGAGPKTLAETSFSGNSPAVVLAEGSRIVFLIPWGNRLILGTTDTDYTGPNEAVRTEPDDVRYLLEVANRYFPDAKLSPSDILADWAGIRPLIYTGRGGPSDISRAHLIRSPQPGWIDVAGGKLTTYRLIAEEVLEELGRQWGHRLPPCRTAQLPLLESHAELRWTGILPPPVSAEVIQYFCQHEWTCHLDDLMIRRTSWHYYLPDPAHTAQTVAGWMGQCLGWTLQQQEAEYNRYLESAGVTGVIRNREY